MRATCPAHLTHPHVLMTPLIFHCNFFFWFCYRVMDNGREEGQIRLRLLVPTVLGRHDLFGVGSTQELQEGLLFTRHSGRR